MKGAIRPDHMPANNYQLLVIGGPPVIAFTKVSGIEEELTRVMLPDFTAASGGRKNPVTFTAELPMHHLVEQSFMEFWFREGQDPVVPTYKKLGVLVHKSNSGVLLRPYQLVGLFVHKRKLPDLDMHNEGDMTVSEWTFSADDVITI